MSDKLYKSSKYKPLQRILSKVNIGASKASTKRRSIKTKKSDGSMLGKRSESSFSRNEKKSSIDRTYDYISDHRTLKTRGKSEEHFED